MNIVHFVIIIGILSLLFNLLIILWIENYISFNYIISIGLFISLALFEIIKIMLIVIVLIKTVNITEINRILKILFQISFIIGIIISVYFLIRFFGMACYFPLLSFISVIFCLFSSYLLIIIKNKIQKAS